MPTDAQNHRPRFALWHHCLLMLFFFLHLLGLHRNVKEILIAVIPNRSTFKQWDICSPSLRDHSKKKKKKSVSHSSFIHSLSSPLSSATSLPYSPILYLLLLIQALTHSSFSFSPCFPFLMYVSMGLFICNSLHHHHHHHQHHHPHLRRKAGMCQTVASL